MRRTVVLTIVYFSVGRQKQLLRRHQNLYHNPDYVPKPPKEKTHSCQECKRTFAHKGNLIRHLAVHDPDSGHQERALELKLGREKKVKIVDGQIIKVRILFFFISFIISPN